MVHLLLLLLKLYPFHNFHLLMNLGYNAISNKYLQWTDLVSSAYTKTEKALLQFKHLNRFLFIRYDILLTKLV